MNSFSRTYLLVFAFAGVLLAGFAYLTDPYALFDTERIDGVNRYKPVGLIHIRLSKAYRVSRSDYDVLILGSSRTGRGLNCGMLGDAKHGCYNASSTAATPLESLRYLQQQKPGKVYLGLDFFTIIEQALVNESFVDNRLILQRDGMRNFRFYQQWITDHFGALLSWQALRHSQLTLRSQGKARILPTGDGMPFILGDGSWGEDATRLEERGKNVRGKSQEKRFLHIYRVMSLLFNRSLEYHESEGVSVNVTINAHLQAFRDIVAYCHENDIELKLFFNAAHAYYWQLAYEEMGRSALDHWKRRVTHINQSVASQFDRRPYPLHDFSGINHVSVQAIPSASNGHQLADRFQDPMHYSLAIGQRMIDVMNRGCEAVGEEGWGACLERENLNNHLLEQWRRYTAFHKLNRAEIAHFRRRVVGGSAPGS